LINNKNVDGFYRSLTKWRNNIHELGPFQLEYNQLVLYQLIANRCWLADVGLFYINHSAQEFVIFRSMQQEPEIRTVETIRYLTPLREGGSLPAIVEADDGFLYVLKFRGAGQGIKALIAELIGGMIAKAAGLKTPEIVFAQVDPAFGRTEPDEEIQDLLKASEGLNLAIHYLSGAISFDPVVNRVDPLTASKIVWLDSLLMNVDRTPRNTNMLIWQKELWLIDFGASLYFHHGTDNFEMHSMKNFVQIKDHVLLPYATEMERADKELKEMLSPSVISSIVALVPADWLLNEDVSDADIMREQYVQFLLNRIHNSQVFLNVA
jgi:hypothetical protein